MPYFEITSHQYLSKATPITNPSAMQVRRKVFGKHHYENIEKYSDLLNKYNEAIDMTHLYVLREDVGKAKEVISAFESRVSAA